MPYLFKLKLLNGPLFGRELKLRKGGLKLGNDSSDPDIVLPLVGDAQYIEFHTDEDSITLASPAAGWIGDKQVSAIAQLPVGQPVMIAGVGFVIGKLEDDLSHYGSWQPSEPKTSSSFLITAMAFLLLLAITIATLFIFSQADENQKVPFNARQWIEQFQHNAGLKEIRFNWLSDNTLEIQGWCQHEVSLAPLFLQLRQHQIAFVNRAMCEDQLLKNVRYAIQLYGYENIQVDPGEHPGDVMINGTIEDDKRWQEVEKLLGTMVGLKKWNVVNQSDSQTGLIIQQLKKIHLLGKLSIRKSNGRIILSGKLNDKDVDMLAGIIRTFMQKNPSALPIVFQNIQAIDASNDVLPAPIISVGGNANSPYLELSNGMRLQKGAELPSGYVIRNIDGVNGVELSRHGQLVHIPLGF